MLDFGWVRNSIVTVPFLTVKAVILNVTFDETFPPLWVFLFKSGSEK